MSYLTEKRNNKIIAEKRRKINEIKNNELNKECFDCGSCYPEYISINNGIFICNNCIKIHNTFPKEISLTLKNDLSTLNNKELEYMYKGGNQKLMEFIHYEFPELKKLQKNILYQTKAMQFYRDNLNYLVNSGPEPIRPSKEINAYELIDYNKEIKNKKYERINLGDTNKSIYKTKKRNKSVGNRKCIGNGNKINEKERIRKESRNKSFRKNHFLDDDNEEEELKRHQSFYKEMNKIFKDEEDNEKKDYKYYRKKSNKFISNDIINNKFIKYNSKTNDNNKNNYKEYPIENIYNNNYFNLTTTKNIFMLTPAKNNILYSYRQLNDDNNINQIDNLYLTNVKEIYSKPKIPYLINSNQNQKADELFISLIDNINKLNLTEINSYRKINDSLNNNRNIYEKDNNNYISTNTYNRRINQNKTKELFSNININKNNIQNNNLIRYIKRNEKKKEKEKEEINKRTNYTFRENNKIQIKEIKIEKIGKKRINNHNDINSEINNISNNINYPKEQKYKKLSKMNINKIDYNKNNNIEEKEKLFKHIQTENENNSKEKKIKNINIFFDKNKNSIKNETKKLEIKNIETNYNTLNSGRLISNKKLDFIGNSINQKMSIRNKYKMKRKLDNL